MRIGRNRWLCAVLLSAPTLGYVRAAEALQLKVQSALYPAGHAEAVYRVVLDTLYHSLGERPPYIVLFDSAHYRVSYCEARICPVLPPHKSNIDAETISDFAQATLVQSPMRRDFKFGRRVSFLSSTMMMKGLIEVGALLSDSVQNVYRYAEAMPFWIGFRKTFPGAWGYAVLTRVGFNETHTQALVQVHHQCGSGCGHFEDMFLERREGSWRVAERILLPNYGQDWVDIVQSVYSPNADGRDSVVFGSLRYLGPDARRLADTRKRADSIRAFIRDSVARDQLPRRLRLTVINGYTGQPLAKANVVVHSRADSMRVPLVADSKGRLVVRDFPLGGTMLEVRCPGPRDDAQFSRRYLGDTGIYMFAAIDTTITIRIPDLKPCWERKLHRLQAGWLESTEARAATYPGGDDAEVVAAVLEQFVSETPAVLLNITRKHCMLSDPACGGVQLARLENIGVIDSTAIRDFLITADSSTTVRPSFALSRRYEMITHNEIRYLIGEAEPVGQGTSTLGEHDYFRRRPDDLLEIPSFWNAFHTLYGTTARLVSVSRVGFNTSHTQALVQVLTATNASARPRLVLLEKEEGRWRVERPAIEREEDSARLEGGRCVWKSLPGATVKPAISGLVGQFRLTQVTMSPTPRIQLFTISLLKGPSRHFVRGEIYHANGERQPELEVYVGTDTTTAFMDVRATGKANGLLQRFRIHEIRGGNFYGSWVPPQARYFPVDSPLGGIANPGGYFCAEGSR